MQVNLTSYIEQLLVIDRFYMFNKNPLEWFLGHKKCKKVDNIHFKK